MIDDPVSDVYPRLTPEQKDVVEAIRCKAPHDATAEDWHTLLDICKSCPA